MDADCIIKLAKSNLKELVCKNFTVIIPEVVKEEVIDKAQGQPDAVVIKGNIEKNLLTISKVPSSVHRGEDAVFRVFQRGRFDAICSDDKRFIKRLRLFDIPYITPSVFIVLLLKGGKLTVKEASKKLESVSPFVSDDEYNAIKLILDNWRA